MADRSLLQKSGITLTFVARASAVVVAIWAIANLLWLGREILFVAFLAVLLASFLSLFVDFLERWRVPRGIAAVGTLVALLGILVTLAILVWPALGAQFGSLARDLPESLARVVAWAQGQLRALTGAVGGSPEQIEGRLRARLGADLTTVVAGALPLLNTAVGALLGVFIIMTSALYMAISPGTYRNGAIRLLPERLHARAHEVARAVGHVLRMWMVGAAVSMLLVGTLTALGLWVLGVPSFLALGFIAGLLEFVPYFGPIAAAVPAIGMGLAESTATGLYVAVLYTAIQQIESNVIQPLVMKRAVELPPALTIFTQALMGVLFGFLGLLLAVPLLAMTRVLVLEIYLDERTLPEADTPTS